MTKRNLLHLTLPTTRTRGKVIYQKYETPYFVLDKITNQLQKISSHSQQSYFNTNKKYPTWQSKNTKNFLLALTINYQHPPLS